MCHNDTLVTVCTVIYIDSVAHLFTMMHLPTWLFNNRNATPKGNMFCQHMQAHLQILLIMKKGYKQVNEKDF